MGGYSQPLSESLGMPQDLAARTRRGGYDLGGPMRNRGLIQALSDIQQTQPAGTNRVADDPATRANPEAYGPTTPSQSPVSASPSNPLTDKMWEEYNKLGQPEPQAPPPSLKDRLLQGLLRAAPIAAGALAGGTYGASGAAQGEGQAINRQQGVRLAQQQMAQQHQQQRDSLRERMLQEILQQQRMQQQSDIADRRIAAGEQRTQEMIGAGQEKQQRTIDETNALENQREAARQSLAQQSQTAAEERQNKNISASEERQNKSLAAASARQDKSLAAMMERQNAKGQTEKATADEQRRADLANNMTQNLNELEDIVKRRPDLFGPVGGRKVRLEQWDNPLNPFAGTRDPDIAKLKAIREYLGMASVGTHAMRNAQHVGAAADAVTGSFMNSPQATMAAIQDARNSIETFKQDVLQKGGMVGGVQGNRPAGGGQRGPQPGTVEDGYRFKGGDPANQANWEKVR